MKVGQADEPEGEQVAAIEGEVQEAAQVEEEGIGEVLCLVDDDDGMGAALIDHVQQDLFEVGPELTAAVGGNRPAPDVLEGSPARGRMRG